MDNYNFEKSNNFQSKSKEFTIFLGLKIPKFNKWNLIWKKLISNLIMLVCFFVTIMIYLSLFYIENLVTIFKNDDLFSTSFKSILMESYVGNYIAPLVFYIAREIISNIQRRITKKLTDWEDHISVQSYQSEMATKKIVFEFFNYYFNLYFIAFIKQFYNLCKNDSCFDELGSQVFFLIQISIIVDLTKIFWLLVFRSNKEKEIKKNLYNELEKEHLENGSKKMDFYIRKEYKADNVFDEYFEILLIFGYIVQFGCSHPLSFLFVFIHAYFARISDTIKLVKLQNVRIIDGTQGLGKVNDFIRILTMIGLITNVLIIFFTNGSHVGVDLAHKFIWVLLLQNTINFSNYFLSFNTNPSWFKYKEKIEINYINKFVETKK